jgi:sugar phosphate permease
LSAGFLSQALVGRGVRTRISRAVVGCVPMIIGGLLVLCVPAADNAAIKIALLVTGGGLTGPIYVVCAPMISEFTPIAQRGAVIAIFGAIYTLAGVIAPYVNGSMIENASSVLQGYQNGYMVSGSIQIAGGIAGLLLMWPAACKARIRQHRLASAPAGAIRSA